MHLERRKVMSVNTKRLIALVCLTVLAGCGRQEPEKTESQQQPSATTTTIDNSKQETGPGEVYEGTILGVISDSMCGKDHSKMGELGKDPAACIKKCVASGGKYVLVDETGEVYSLSDQDKPADFAGKSVSIEGHIDPKEKAIHVHSLAAK